MDMIHAIYLLFEAFTCAKCEPSEIYDYGFRDKINEAVSGRNSLVFMGIHALLFIFYRSHGITHPLLIS